MCPTEVPMIVQTSAPTEDHGCKACEKCPARYVSVVQTGYNATNACAGYSICFCTFCPLRRAR